MIKDATFISVWDGGIVVSSPCRVNTATGEIFNIGSNDYPGDDGELKILDREYVSIDGIDYPVARRGEAVEDEEFQYE